MYPQLDGCFYYEAVWNGKNAIDYNNLNISYESIVKATLPKAYI